jgi:hypothetical protein
MLNQGCGHRRYATLPAAEKAVTRGAEGTPRECIRGGLLHWHLAAATGNPVPPQVRELVLARDGHRCACCNKSILGRRYSLGHRMRASQGGRPVASNLIVVLGWGGEACHGRIDSRRDPADEDRGLTVRSWQDPLEIPVKYMTPAGVLEEAWLTDDGQKLTAPPGLAA